MLRCWRIANGDDMPAADAVRLGYRRGPRVLLAAFLYGLVAMLGLILLIVPGIYLAGAMALFIAPILFEDLRAVASLSRSRELMRGHWWRGATVLAVPLILVTVVLIVVQVLPLFIFGVDISGGDYETFIPGRILERRARRLVEWPADALEHECDAAALPRSSPAS